MRRYAQKIWDSLARRSFRPEQRSNLRELSRPRLEVERLEDRWVPTAPVPQLSNALSGVAFVDHNGTGVFGSGDAALTGLTITLTGTTYKNTAINISTTTTANGSFDFLNVPKGTYQLSAPSLPQYLGGTLTFGDVQAPAGVNVVTGTVNAGQNATASFSVRGLAPTSISLTEFLNTAGPINAIGPAGAASVATSGPTVSNAISNVALTSGGSSSNFLLAGNFSAPDLTTSDVQFVINHFGTVENMNVQLFDQQTPQTVANFYDYILGTSGSNYTNSIFQRLVPGFILQGGDATLATSGSTSTLTKINAFPDVPSEAGISNTTGTLAMALSGSPSVPGTANDNFYFNLVNNDGSGVNNLNAQGFTVFGKVSDAAGLQLLQQLGSASTLTETVSGGSVPVPMKNYSSSDTNFPTDTTASNFEVLQSINIVNRNEFLTYSIQNPGNTGIVTATIKNNLLTLTPGTSTGTTTVVVRATDVFGSFVDMSIPIKVS